MFKLERPREFKIETFYYNQDEEVDPKRRIHFRRIRHSKPAAKGNSIRLVMVIVILLVVIYILHKKGSAWQEASEPGKITVQEIIIID